jgi:cobalt-zinc-cadmium efflux system membrane fusion protein
MNFKSLIILCLSLALQIACKNNAANTETTKTLLKNTNENIVQLNKMQQKNAEIETTEIQLTNINSILKLNGKIETKPQSILSVCAPLGGYLKSTKLLPGMYVHKGEVIAEIEDHQFIELQQDFLLTKSKLHFTTLDYYRQKELNETKSSSEKIMQQAFYEMEQQQILLNSLNEKLKLININPENVHQNNISKKVNLYATISGYVSKINSNPGKYIAPTDIIFEIIDPSKIYLKLNAFEKDINSLQINQNIQCFSNSNPELIYEGKIILINKNINPDGLSEIYCSFNSFNNNLVPGMYMNAEIQIQNNKTYVLPEKSIVNFEGKNFVFIKINENDFEMIEVQTGNNKNNLIEIINYQNLMNKIIVTNGAYAILMKLKNTEE